MRISEGDDTSPVGNDRIPCGRFARISKFRLTLIWSKGKNVENKNEGLWRGTRVTVRAREVSRSIYFHFQHFYLSTYVPFLFSTFLLLTKVGGIQISGYVTLLIRLEQDQLFQFRFYNQFDNVLSQDLNNMFLMSIRNIQGTVSISYCRPEMEPVWILDDRTGSFGLPV
jgi:hypothetical protein